MRNLVPWRPGQTGNPTGKNGWTPTEREIRELAKANAPHLVEEAIERAYKSDDDRVTVAVTSIVLERAYGKPREEAPEDLSQAKPDLSRLSPKERKTLLHLLKKALGRDIDYEAEPA